MHVHFDSDTTTLENKFPFSKSFWKDIFEHWKVVILIFAGYQNKMLRTSWKFTSSSFPRSRCLLIGSWRGLSPWMIDGHFLAMSSHGREGGFSPTSSTWKVSNPMMRDRLSWPDLTVVTSYWLHFQTPSLWGLWLQYMNFDGEGHKRSVDIWS